MCSIQNNCSMLSVSKNTCLILGFPPDRQGLSSPSPKDTLPTPRSAVLRSSTFLLFEFMSSVQMCQHQCRKHKSFWFEVGMPHVKSFTHALFSSQYRQGYSRGVLGGVSLFSFQSAITAVIRRKHTIINKTCYLILELSLKPF